MKFKYKRIPIQVVNGKIAYVYRPIIPVTLSNGDVSLRYEVLIDSGADENVFDGELAPMLGFEEKDIIGEKDFYGIGMGKVHAYKFDISIGFGGHSRLTTCYFAEDLGRNQYGIVGQKGFFDLFRIRFVYSKKDIEIVPDKEKIEQD